MNLVHWGSWKQLQQRRVKTAEYNISALKYLNRLKVSLPLNVDADMEKFWEGYKGKKDEIIEFKPKEGDYKNK